MTDKQHEILKDLLYETQTGNLYDAEKYGTPHATLRSLEQQRLATYVGDDLWRCTLAAITYARTGILPTPKLQNRRGAPSQARQRVYNYLRNHGSSTTTQLANEFHVHRASIRKIFDYLEQHDLIEVERKRLGPGKRQLVATIK